MVSEQHHIVDNAVITATPLSPEPIEKMSPSTTVLIDTSPMSLPSQCSHHQVENSSIVTEIQCEVTPLPKRILNTCGHFVYSCIPVFVPVFIVILIFILAKSYVEQCVLWLDGQEEWIVFLVFTLLYVAVSFPVVWGYIVLNIGCGYHFGLIAGVLVTALAVAIGLTLAHVLMKACCSQTLRKHLIHIGLIKSMVEVMGSSQAFKVIVVSRLSPIPFGLQNAAFAVSCIGLPGYLLASIIGLLPTQIINVYMGTTVRSMQDVLNDDSTAVAGYIILVLQILGSTVLMTCIVRSAKKELEKTVTLQKPISCSSTSTGTESAESTISGNTLISSINEACRPLIKSPSKGSIAVSTRPNNRCHRSSKDH